MSFDKFLLGNVRGVLTGNILREEVVDYRQKPFVSMGVAIMIAAGYKLDENLKVEGSLGHNLRNLLLAGQGNFEDYEQDRDQYGGSPVEFVTVAAKLELFERLPRGTRGRTPITLNPPADFMEVVLENKHNPAVETFIQEAEAGIARRDRWDERIAKQYRS